MPSATQAPATQTMASTSILSLPFEILCSITNHLTYSSHLALSLTCRELYHRVDTPRQPYTRPPRSKAKVKTYTMFDLLEIENWPEYGVSWDTYFGFPNPKPADRRATDPGTSIGVGHPLTSQCTENGGSVYRVGSSVGGITTDRHLSRWGGQRNT
ncbi:hypothetical protein V499_04448 [Pseudogymnoascus sp. VKM F-103]|nr:hypothetical protein V499_04448 [Pseudogymnoascus sp. VKM F-103]